MSRTRAPTSRDCDACPHHHVDVMGATPEAYKARLLPLFRLRDYLPRETLYTAADQGSHVAVVRSGLVKLSLCSSSGTERIVRLAMPGDTIGLELMLDRTFDHTAVALSAVQVCLMPLGIVEDRLRHSSDFARKLIAEWHASVDDAERFLTELSTGPSPARVARLLLYLRERVPAGPFPALSRDDIASLLGITMETASRVIAEFKRAGYLHEDVHGTWRCERLPLVAIAERIRAAER